MNYEEVSDFEINRSVAINRGGYQGPVDHMTHGVKESDRVSSGLFYTERDYCNNPSDAWPIICEVRLAIMPWNDREWQSFVMINGEPVHRTRCENPLRAAMIVFLMMQEDAQ